jgi:hypothetical protein
MSTESAPLFRVLVLSLPESPIDLASTLESHLGLNRIDARIQLHNLPGVLKPTFNSAAADRLVAAIREAGGYAVPMEDTGIPDLTHPQPLHHVRCLDPGLEIVRPNGTTEQTLDWERISLLNIGVLPLETAHHEDTESALFVRSAPHSSAARVDLESMRGPEAWLIADGDPFSCWVFKQTEMNYEYLGDRKQPSASLNFRLLIDDLIARAKRMYLAPPARAFTGHGLFLHYAFDSEQDLRENTLFHLLIRRRMQAENLSPPGT